MRLFDRSEAAPVPNVGLPACVLVFWMLGPFIGYLVFLADVAIETFHEPPSSLGFDGRMLNVALLGLLFVPAAWLAGSLPAIATAIAYWALPAALRATIFRAVVASTLIGIVVCGVVVAFSKGFDVLLQTQTRVVFLEGGVAAGVCAWAVQWIERRSRDA